MQQSCSCRDRNVLYRDIKFVAPSSLYTSASRNYRDVNFLCPDKHFSFHVVYSVVTEFSFVATNFSSLVLAAS